MNKIVFIVLIVLVNNISLAQRYNFKQYAVSDGLAQSQVRDICQDKYGYLWIGTASGLSRYDGIEFVNYSKDDGLPDNNINNVFVNNDGRLWVSTANGVSYFEDQKFHAYYFDNPYRINEITSFKNEIYFASNTGLIQLKNAQFNRLGKDHAEQNLYIRSVVNYKDSILICGGREGIYTWDGSTFSQLHLPNQDNPLNIRSLSLRDDELFIAARMVGIVSYNLTTKQKKHYPLTYTTAYELAFHKDNIYGISTNAGAFLIQGDETIYFNGTNGLNWAGLECTYIDNEGNLWIGSDGNGLIRFSGTAIVSYSTTDGIGSNLVLAIEQDKDGHYLFGTYDAGLTCYSVNEQQYFNVRNSDLIDNTVWCVYVDTTTDQTWLGTSRGLTIMDNERNVIESPLNQFEIKIRTILKVNEEVMLFGGDEGLLVKTKDSVYRAAQNLNINKLIALDGAVYCAAAEGLYILNLENLSDYQQVWLPESKIFTLAVDPYKNLWIGSENGLFVRLKNGRIVPFPLDLDNKDYRSKNILGLIASEAGDIWISTMNGVFQVSENNEESGGPFIIRNYGSPEGVIDEESNVNAIFEDNSHKIWIGTANGLVRIDPEFTNELFEYKAPEVHLRGIRLMMESFDYSDYPVVMNPDLDVPISIVLPYNKNHVTFDFIGINLKDPKSILYEYRLIGADEQWLPLSRSNYATYSFLQPGTYTFEVRAINKNKKWLASQSFDLTIKPPFWRTWWFIFLVSIAAILTLLAIFQFRIRTIKQRQDNEKLALKNRLLFLEQRSLNASMNRHFIFNSLNSIQYFINSSDKLSANKFLSNFAKLIRKNLDSSAANNFIVTLQEEIERIELYLSLEKMRFSDKFDYEMEVSPSLDTESIEIPSMILQPFVENSIIHGVLSLQHKGKIKIEIRQELGEVVFEVTDNGLGIENSLKSKSIVPRGDHESQGMEITNRRIEILRKLTGENLLIIGPFQMNDEEGNSVGTKVVLKLGGINKYE